MHYKVTMIVGLPGSGKTTLAASMVDSNTFLIDDPSKSINSFKEALDSGKSNIIICDPLLVITKRDIVINFIKNKFGKDVDINWIYFDNDPTQAWFNHDQRNKTNYRELSKSLFDDMSKKYKIPLNSTIIPVYKG